jgi:hypothetical protein
MECISDYVMQWWEVIPPVFWSIALGGLGWLTISFVFKPWLDFLELRREIHQTLIFYSNIYSNWHEVHSNTDVQKEWREAQIKFRQVSCRLQALYESFWPWHYAYERCRGYKINEASDSLCGISNEVGDFVISFANDVRIRLRLRGQLSLKDQEALTEKLYLNFCPLPK